jgi:hypothetical protein
MNEYEELLDNIKSKSKVLEQKKLERENAYKEFGTAVERCDADFCAYVDGLVKKDMQHISSINSIIRTVNSTSQVLLQSDIVMIFKTIFKNARSRTHELCKFDTGEKLTIGPNGFGVRLFVQSEPVNTFDDILRIINIKSKVVSALKDKKMHKYASHLEAFDDVIGEYVKMNSLKDFVFDFPEPVISKSGRLFNKVGFRKLQSVYLSFTDSVETVRVRLPPIIVEIDSSTALLYYQLHDYIQRIENDLKVYADKYIKASRNISVLRERFKLELMVSTL